MTQHHSHAIVLGGSIAGLCAARVLADHYSRVTIIERDVLDSNIEPRKGVPQGQHAHVLLCSGARALERMFPGFRAEIIERGALPDDVGRAGYIIAGVRIAKTDSELEILRMSRPLLEGCIRERVRTLPNVRILDACDILGVTVVAAAIRGVRYVHRHLKVEQWLPAEMVVDATGRGSKLPCWLQSCGFEMPAEDRVKVDIGYTTCIYKRPESTRDRAGVMVGALAPNKRCGVGAALEGDRFIVSLVGYLGDHAPTDAASMPEFARTLPAPDLFDIIRDAEPITKAVQGRFPHSQRRYYERLDAFPSGLLAIGDALCAFNPNFAQGMSVAILEAELLGRLLPEHSSDALRRAYFQGCSAIIETPWSLSVGADLRFPQVEGPRPLASRLRNRYLKRLLRAAGDDAEIALAYLRVSNLVRPPASLFAPRIVARVARHALAARPRPTQLSVTTNATEPA